MNRKYTPLFLLILSLLSFLATAALYFNVTYKTPDTDHKAALAAIVVQVQEEVDKAQQNARVIGSRLNDRSVSFTSLLQQCRYPMFIYRGGSLVFWSDHTIAPSLDRPASADRLVAISNRHGSFLVVPYRAGPYNIKAYIPLQQDNSSDGGALSREVGF